MSLAYECEVFFEKLGGRDESLYENIIDLGASNDLIQRFNSRCIVENGSVGHTVVEPWDNSDRKGVIRGVIQAQKVAFGIRSEYLNFYTDFVKTLTKTMQFKPSEKEIAVQVRTLTMIEPLITSMMDRIMDHMNHHNNHIPLQIINDHHNDYAQIIENGPPHGDFTTIEHA